MKVQYELNNRNMVYFCILLCVCVWIAVIDCVDMWRVSAGLCERSVCVCVSVLGVLPLIHEESSSSSISSSSQDVRVTSKWRWSPLTPVTRLLQVYEGAVWESISYGNTVITQKT